MAPLTDEEKEKRLKKSVTTLVIFPLSWFPQNTGKLVFNLKEQRMTWENDMVIAIMIQCLVVLAVIPDKQGTSDAS